VSSSRHDEEGEPRSEDSKQDDQPARRNYDGLTLDRDWVDLGGENSMPHDVPALSGFDRVNSGSSSTM